MNSLPLFLQAWYRVIPLCAHFVVLRRQLRHATDSRIFAVPLHRCKKVEERNDLFTKKKKKRKNSPNRMYFTYFAIANTVSIHLSQEIQKRYNAATIITFVMEATLLSSLSSLLSLIILFFISHSLFHDKLPEKDVQVGISRM